MKIFSCYKKAEDVDNANFRDSISNMNMPRGRCSYEKNGIITWNERKWRVVYAWKENSTASDVQTQRNNATRWIIASAIVKIIDSCQQYIQVVTHFEAPSLHSQVCIASQLSWILKRVIHSFSMVIGTRRFWKRPIAEIRMSASWKTSVGLRDAPSFPFSLSRG